MVRTSPVVPEVGFGQHRFQPLWFKDFGKALLACTVRPEPVRQVLEVAGDEVLTVSDLLRMLSRLTYRPAFPIPLPAFLVRSALWVFERTRRFLPRHAHLPLNESKLTMLVEENMIPAGRPNALTDSLHITPTPLHEALRELTQCLPENPPETGVGSLERKRFWADFSGTTMSPQELMTLFKTRINEVMPIDFSAEPDAPRHVEEGATLSARLPGRGNIQVRVQECEPDRVTFSTIEGHPLAGIVTFSARQAGPLLRFTVETLSRPANTVDWVAISLAGRWLQDLTWQNVVGNMARLSGGTAPDGVQHQAQTLDEAESREIEQWASDLIARRKRERVEEEVAARS
jgi:NADH dehydrogenase